MWGQTRRRNNASCPGWTAYEYFTHVIHMHMHNHIIFYHWFSAHWILWHATTNVSQLSSTIKLVKFVELATLYKICHWRWSLSFLFPYVDPDQPTRIELSWQLAATCTMQLVNHNNSNILNFKSSLSCRCSWYILPVPLLIVSPVVDGSSHHHCVYAQWQPFRHF